MGPGSWFGEGTDVSTGMLIVGFGQVYFFTAFVIFAGMLLNEIGYLTWALTPLGIGLVLYWLLGDLDLVDDLMFPLVAAALVFIVGSVSLLIGVNIVEWGLNLR